jgi:UrcA family protein
METVMSMFAYSRRLALFGATALTLLAAPAVAQDYYGDVSYDRDQYRDQYNGPTEEVIVQAPEYYRSERDSATGAPIRDVALQSEIAYDDLDLRSGWGARELHNRVAREARSLCARLDARFPVTADGSPNCYRTAYNDAMEQADAAIARARGY